MAWGFVIFEQKNRTHHTDFYQYDVSNVNFKKSVLKHLKCEGSSLELPNRFMKTWRKSLRIFLP